MGDRRLRAGQKLDEMFGYTDRSDSRAAAAVWDAKRLVQIQMTNIGAVIAGATKPTCAFKFAPSM